MIKKKHFILCLVLTVFFTGILAFTISNYISITVGDKVVVTKSDYRVLQDSKKLLSLKKYIDKNYLEFVDSQVLMEGAAKGLFDSLDDPYSIYMNEKEFNEFNESTSGIYGGIGVIVTEKDGYVTVVAPIEDTPGDKAGLRTGDRIIKVDDIDTMGIGLDKATSLMKGKKGTKVKLTIIRDDKESPIAIDIKREEIVLKTVKSETLEDDIAYIRISMFDQDTGKEFKKAIKEVDTNTIKGLIIDLRQNPGGFVKQCIDVADELLDKGIIFYTEDKYKNRDITYSKEGKVSVPYILLVDGGSASASEIVAGAVKDRKEGLIIGEKTFGKGLVQTVEKLNDGSGFKLTTQKYYTPNGISINKIGIEPDIVVPAFDGTEDKDTGIIKDIQLERAVEELQKIVD
ncbi:MAG: S41 family peptidase [Clostridiales bacterium]|nr:S41 family peptidase [Clostridiales bacterium]